MTPKAVRIAIADDHKLMLEGMATLIQSISGLELCGKASTGKELLALVQSMPVPPDICIVDIEMPELDGIETARRLRTAHPSVKVLALTMHHESHFVSRMIAAGAHGYLLKNVDRTAFIASIERLMADEGFFVEGMSEPTASSSGEPLTQRERQILKLIAMGKSNKEIAEDLFISDRTADTHRTNIKRKLKLSSLAQLIQYAKEHGILS